MARRSSNWGRHFRCTAVLLGVLGVGATLHAQVVQFKIKVLNGGNGHPVARSCVFVSVLGNPMGFFSEEVVTDDKGGVDIRLSKNASVSPGRKTLACFGEATAGAVLGDGYLVDIIPNPHKATDCRPPPNKRNKRFYSFPVEFIFRRGVVGANTCGKAAATPTPGEVILFVKPLHWWNPKVIWYLLKKR